MGCSRTSKWATTMTTLTSDDYPAARPESFGLPGGSEVAAAAASYFPEFSPSPPAPGQAAPSYRPSVSPAHQSARLVRPGGAPGFGFSRSGGAYVGDAPLDKIRADFPILSERVNGHPLVWLDNAATTQRPRQVIERISRYYERENSNVHRGAHTLAARSTDAYEAARGSVARFIGAPGPGNIIFVRGATEAINLVANACVKPTLRPGDEIILTALEHHANIVPWQMIAEEIGAVIKVAPVDDDGQIIVSEYAALFRRATRFVSLTHVSNAIGSVVPAGEMISIAHGFGARVLVDGAQSVSHMPVNVSELDADFFAFSGHKIFGPTGIGALYGRDDALESARPWQGGGNMIADVTFERTLYQRHPQKFEAGTGSIADAAGLGAAIDYVSGIGMSGIAAYEGELLEHGLRELSSIPGLTLVGRAAPRASVMSFVLDGVDDRSVARYLDEAAGIAVRSGHHCAQPILRRFGLESTVRPSVAFYNTHGEIELLARTLRELARKI